MARHHQITIDGRSFLAQHGQLLLDAALSNGIALPHDCRAGHCGTCCVQLVAGEVDGGAGTEPGVVHACQCRIVGDADIETKQRSGVRSVEGVLSSLRPLSPEVMEVGITTDSALPYLAGQYAQVRFSGYPSRPFSITHRLRGLDGKPDGRTIWFHVRRMSDGRVTTSLGKRIKIGHRVKITGPYGSAHFRPNVNGSLILVGTSTGFAPIWSVAVAALRERPKRSMVIIAGGRSLASLYMWPALMRLVKFPNVHVVPFCSTQQNVGEVIQLGRPTDFLPRLLPSDVLYACGAPAMVDSIKLIAARSGTTCYADAFLPATEETAKEGVVSRATKWLAARKIKRVEQPVPGHSGNRREWPVRAYGMAEARMRSQYRSQRA